MTQLRRLLVLATLVLAFGAAFAGPAAARATEGDDVVMAIRLATTGADAGAPTAGSSFKVDYEIDTTAGLVQNVKLTVALPGGLHWGADGPDPGEGCEGTAPAVCSQKLYDTGVGTIGGGYVWDVVADAPGTYDVSAFVETTEPDPNTSNNSATLEFVVAPASTPTSAHAAVSATTAKIGPAKPKAGSPVTVTVRVSAGGTAVRPRAITCAARIGNAKARWVRKAAKGSASCRFATPHNAKGKALRGTISFTAGSKKITRRFSTRLR
jgi:hypothetical protein